jgi:hypothetical protein
LRELSPAFCFPNLYLVSRVRLYERPAASPKSKP